MLSVITEEDTSCNYIEAFKSSQSYIEMMNLIEECLIEPKAEDEIKFPTKFAASWWKRQLLTEARFRKIYFRSPAYNLVRLSLSVVIAFILGSMFLSDRKPSKYEETNISSFFATIFISFIITGILAINSVLPVMLKLRDSFYRHRAAGMLGPNSIALALGAAEKWFIVLSTILFCFIFLSTAGLTPENHPVPRFIGKDLLIFPFFFYVLAPYWFYYSFLGIFHFQFGYIFLLWSGELLSQCPINKFRLLPCMSPYYLMSYKNFRCLCVWCLR